MPVENNLLELMPNFVKKHWDYEKNDIDPEEVSIFSEEKFYWKNESTTSFYFKPSKVHSRLDGTSLPEQTIFYFLSKIFKDIKSRYVFVDNYKNYEADIYIPCVNLVIEYDGAYYHRGKNKFILDVKKNEFFESKGLFCIRIRERGLQKLPGFNGVVINKERLEDIDMVNIVIKNIKNYLILNDYNDYFNKICKFKISEEEYKDSLNKIYKLMYLDVEDVDSCEAIVNFYKIHKNEIYSNSMLKTFVDLWQCCDYEESPFIRIKDKILIQEVTKIKRLYFFDFSLFTTKEEKQWLYNYWINLISSDPYVKDLLEITMYDVLKSNLIKELGDEENIYSEGIILKKGLNISNEILSMMQMLCKQIIQKYPDYYRKWSYEKIIHEIDQYLRNENQV